MNDKKVKMGNIEVIVIKKILSNLKVGQQLVYYEPNRTITIVRIAE